MKRAQRHTVGCVRLDKRRGTWNYLYYDNGTVQQKLMRHSDIRTTMNIYGDVVTDEMSVAGAKVAELAFRGNGAQTER